MNSKITSFLSKYFLFLIIFQVTRSIFYFVNHLKYQSLTATELFFVFFNGIRFDWNATSYLVLPLILFMVVPKKAYVKISGYYFFVISFIVFLIEIDDAELINYSGKRLSKDYFLISDDIFRQLGQVVINYWYIPCFVFILSLLFSSADKYLIKKIKIKKNKIVLVLIFLNVIIGFRGGTQRRPLSIQSAFAVNEKHEVGYLVLNSSFNFLRSLKTKSYQKFLFFTSLEEAKNHLITLDLTKSILPINTNVVIIILESFSLEYVKAGGIKSYAPFFDELGEKGIIYSKHFANGRKSIDLLPAIFSNFPALLEEPLSLSPFQSYPLPSLARELKNNNYSTAFFHGGIKGTMGFDQFCLANGFDKYFSKDDYNGPEEDFDGTWGIFDEPYLKYFASELNKMNEPFFAGVFTLSSHQPYTIPKKYIGKFEKGNLEIHESISYVDNALKEFFEKIKTEKWFKNTLFVVTADHTQKLESEKFQNEIGRFRVPLILFHPTIDLKKHLIDKITQHLDIAPSILDLLGLDHQKFVLGKSILGPNEAAFFGYVDESWLMQKEAFYLYKNEKFFKSIYDYSSGKIGPIMDLDSSNTELIPMKAMLQYYRNSLIENRP
jgi:phosphoglycerol transferase MdoB-like AlkP superfamily enzyme